MATHDLQTSPMRKAQPGSRQDGEALFLEHLPRIERIIAALCRRKALHGADAEDFASTVKLHLIADDYRVLREFRGQARLSTFLTTVIHNQLRDFRIRQWGRWRPSACARRLGAVAVQLEALLLRDGRTFHEAITLLRSNFQVEETEEELEAVAARLPVRHQRYFTGEEVLAKMAGPAEVDPVREREREERAQEVKAATQAALGDMAPEDRTLLRLRFEEGRMVSRIARLLGEEQKPLYRRLYGLFKELRQALEKRGIGWEEAAEALDWRRAEVEIDLDNSKTPDEGRLKHRRNDDLP